MERLLRLLLVVAALITNEIHDSRIGRSHERRVAIQIEDRLAYLHLTEYCFHPSRERDFEPEI